MQHVWTFGPTPRLASRNCLLHTNMPDAYPVMLACFLPMCIDRPDSSLSAADSGIVTYANLALDTSIISRVPRIDYALNDVRCIYLGSLHAIFISMQAQAQHPRQCVVFLSDHHTSNNSTFFAVSIVSPEIAVFSWDPRVPDLQPYCMIPSLPPCIPIPSSRHHGTEVRCC